MYLSEKILKFYKFFLKLNNKWFKRKDATKTKGYKQDYPEKRIFKPYKSLDFSAIYVDDLPDEDKIRKNTIYIVGENGYHWLAAFKCPCGCNDLIQLNLLNEAYPSWRISNRKGNKISLFPSIDRINNCKCHFTITKGKIDWWGQNY